MSTFGIGLIAVPIVWVIYWIRRKHQRILIEGSTIKVGPEQFPVIDQLVRNTAARMNMPQPPDTFIYESNDLNAGAIKTRGTPVILLTDDMVWGAMTTKDTKVLEFVIAHELAHHALGHTNFIRGSIAGSNKTLSRLDEFTCDAVAAEIVQSPRSSVRALALLTIGPQLLPKLNVEDLVRQANEIASHKLSHKVEKSLSHPMLLRRVARVLGKQIKLK